MKALLKILTISLLLLLSVNIFAQDHYTIIVNGKKYKFKTKTVNGKRYILLSKFDHLAKKLKQLEEANPVLTLPQIVIVRDKKGRVYTKLKPKVIKLKLGYIVKTYKLTQADINIEYTYKPSADIRRKNFTIGIGGGFVYNYFEAEGSYISRAAAAANLMFDWRFFYGLGINTNITYTTTKTINFSLLVNYIFRF